MDEGTLQEITRILTDFAAAKSSTQLLDIHGPAQEGSNFRWRLSSNRYKEVSVVVETKKPMFGKPALSGIGVFGLGVSKTLKPKLQDLRDYLATAELTPVR
jgi:hypothetical protein